MNEITFGAALKRIETWGSMVATAAIGGAAGAVYEMGSSVIAGAVTGQPIRLIVENIARVAGAGALIALIGLWRTDPKTAIIKKDSLPPGAP